jgi:hypothetical protein
MTFLVTMYMSVIINSIWYMKWWPSWLQCTCQWLSTTYDIWNDGLPGYNVHVSDYQQHMIYEMMAFLVTMYMSVIINNIWYMKWWPSWLQCTCQWLSTTYDIWNDDLPGYNVHVSNYQQHMIYEMMALLVTMYMSVIINNIWYMKWWPSWLRCTCQ